jgi:hypothetical protein
MFPLAAAATIIPAAMQIGKGIFDSGKANELSEIDRPTREVPQAFQEMIMRQRILAGQTKAPGADVLENRLLSAGASGVGDIKEMASSPSSGLSAISNLYGNIMGSLGDLSVRNQEFSNDQIQNLLSSLPTLAGEQSKNFDFNEADPYLAAKRAEAAYRYSSDQNTFKGVQGVSNIFGALANIS